MYPPENGSNPAAGQPAPAAGSPAPITPAPAAAAPAAVPSPASGPGSSGAGVGSGAGGQTPAVPTPAPTAGAATPAAAGFNAAASPATQAAQAAGQGNPAALAPAQPQVSHEQWFRQQYGMDPGVAHVLMQMGWKQYQGQQAGQPQSQGTQVPQGPKTNLFGLPANFNFDLLNFIQRDANGQLVALPGAPPGAALEVQQYQDKLRDVQRQFFANPEQYLGKFVEERAKEVAAQIVQQQFGQQQQVQTTNAIFKQNAGWMFAKDQGGNTQYQFNPQTGQMHEVLTPAGKYYAQVVQELDRRGTKDPALQHEIAFAMTQNAVYQAELKRQSAGQQGQQAALNFTGAAAGGLPVPTQPQPSNVTPGAAPGAQPGSPMDLRETMRRNLAAAGVTDAMIQTDLAARR
jgi:hypothetical protein